VGQARPKAAALGQATTAAVVRPGGHRRLPAEAAAGMEGVGTWGMEGVSPVAYHYCFTKGLRKKSLYHTAVQVGAASGPVPSASSRGHVSMASRQREPQKRIKELLTPPRAYSTGSLSRSFGVSTMRPFVAEEANHGHLNDRFGTTGFATAGFGTTTSFCKNDTLVPDSMATHRTVIHLKHSVQGFGGMRREFRAALLRKHFSMLRAWRAIDPNGNGRVSFSDFSKATRELGYICDAKAVWQALDANEDGFVTLDEIDPDLANLLQGFSAVLSSACGSAANAWKEYFCPLSVHMRCPYRTFTAAAADLGYAGDVDAVFAALDVDKMSAGICSTEFALLDKWFLPQDVKRWSFSNLRPKRTTLPQETAPEGQADEIREP